MQKLLFPLRYFLLENPEKKLIDVWPPLAMGMLLLLVFRLGSGANFFGSGGFLNNVINLTSSLTGFYVTALVAAATFSHPDLDKVIEHGKVFLSEKDGAGGKSRVALTRREFACIIFGFLSFSTMAFTIVAALAMPIAHAIPKYIQVKGFDLRYILSFPAIFFISFWISHIFTVTMIGIYYLMERMYRFNPKVKTTKTEFLEAASVLNKQDEAE
jgi:hypothetical protein